MRLEELIKIAHTRTEQTLSSYLQSSDSPAPLLQEAIHYAVFNGGKRIRPLLVYLTGHVLGASWDSLDAPAGAVELIHCYSLVHDDLPAMDNADLRRGKPSCHKAFNEACAILAGDALQLLSIDIITKSAHLSVEQQLNMIKVITHASGPQGMLGGQSLDMTGVHSASLLITLYQLKTGALLSACATLGAIAAHVTTQNTLDSLAQFGNHIGLAFQLQDDLLDITATTESMGKPKGLDALNQKITYPVLTSLSAAQQKVESLFDSALTAIESIHNPSLLKEFAYFLLKRQK